MADAVVSSLIQVIFGNLNSSITQELGLAWGLDNELRKLKSILSRIQVVIKDAEEKHTVKAADMDWLTKLKDAAYDADDIVDEFAIEALLRRPEIRGGAIKQVSNFFSRRNPLLFRFKMAQKIKNVLEKLEDIAGERGKFPSIENVGDARIAADEVDRRQTSGFVIETEIYGRDEEKEKIIGLLLANVSRDEDVSICALVGMGGLGKTTLAQLVFNDEKVNNHFDLRIWVCVSEDFEIKRLTKAIIESAGGKVNDISELHPMQSRLREILNGKRFLLVLDDVWNEDPEEWDKLKSVLRCGGRGSSIVVTTRSDKVASIMATVLPWHRLGLLSEDDGWSLFCNRAFGSKEREEDPKLITVGRDIFKKCGGVPLAIKAVSGLLHFKAKDNEWLAIKESETWDILDKNTGILPSLRLSYNHLPSHLRQCFAYCSIFPKDHIMKKEYLIQVWMANGFIQSKGQMDLEDIGEEVFYDLLWRSFFQEPQKDEFGNIIGCKMHDLMHDLALSIMGNLCIITDPSKILEEVRDKGARHLSYHGSSHFWNEISLIKGLNKLQSLRSCHEFGNKHTVQFHNISQFPWNSLRLLELRCSNQNNWSSFTFKCKHLRFLDLSDSGFKMLPESTTCLQNLQILKLNHCENLHKLPKGMRHMRNLRHLGLDGCSSLSYMPPGIGQLTGLRKLSRFIVGEGSGQQIGELKDLNKLRGHIEISNLDNVKISVDAERANLMSKNNLQSLTLTWRKVKGEGDAGQVQSANVDDDDQKVLENLRPNANLKRLFINEYQGSKFPTWMRDHQLLPNLVEISLKNCRRCECFPPFGRLPFLSDLTITGMDVVKGFLDNTDQLAINLNNADQLQAFPSLKTLHIYDAPNLEGLVKSERVWEEIFPCLCKLTIKNCPNLGTLPCLHLLQDLRIWGNNMVVLKSAVENLTSLTSFCMGRFRDLVAIPEEIQNLARLESLEIWHCGIVSLPAEGLQGFCFLTKLMIIDCPKLTSWPEGMQRLSALQQLIIDRCDGLLSLPECVGNLPSLLHLGIYECKNITSLPEGLQQNTTLKKLVIDSCPHLRQRYKKEIGEDWHKLAHIRHVYIV